MQNTQDWYETYTSFINQGYSQRKAAKHMGIPRTTLQHWLSSNEAEKDLQQEVQYYREQSVNIMKDEAKNKLADDCFKEWEATVYGGAKGENMAHTPMNTKVYLGDVELKPHYTPDTMTIEPKEHDNQRILLISDMHIPYHHPDTLAFLSYLKAKYNPTRVICLGDEVDKHSLSYHEKSPELPSAMDELKQALPVIAELHKIFPKLDLLDSNHGSLVYRKAKTHGIPKHYIKSYNDVLNVGDSWKWHFDLMITLPDGNKCYLHHGKAARCLQLAEKMGCCAVEGHYHNSFSIEYYGTPFALNWAMQVGCLIDFKSLAFSYANVNIKKPVVGTGLIIDSQPILVSMLLDEHGKWIKPKDCDAVVGVRDE